MDHIKSQLQPKRHRVFLSSTFLDNQEIRTLLIEKLKYARVFYSVMETFVGEFNDTLQAKLEKEIDTSDIYILLVKHNKGSGVVDGNVTATQYEFRHARKHNKLILPYLKDNGSYDNFGDSETTEFRQEVSSHYKYSSLEGNPEAAATKIFCDILFHVSFNESLPCWIKSDFNRNDIKDKMFSRMSALTRSLTQTNIMFRNNSAMLDLPENEKEDLLGRLIDAGVMNVQKNTAYRFVKPEFSMDALKPEEDSFEEEYCYDRFDRYANGVIYDRKLKLYWYYFKKQSFSYSEATQWCLNIPENMEELSGGLWSLPSIDQLMSLMTAERQESGFIDAVFDTEKVHWFWSETLVNGGNDACYIETIDRKVHADPISEVDVHKKALIACSNEKPFSDEPPLNHIYINTPSPDVSALNKANGNMLYQIYFSRNLYSLLGPMIGSFEKHYYYITSFDTIGARSSTMEDSVEEDIRLSDIYCIYINGTETNELKNQIRLEVSKAEKHVIPVLLFIQSEIQIDLSIYGLEGYGNHSTHTHVSSGINLEPTVLAAVHNTLPSVCGWMQKSDYDSVKGVIADINRIEEKILNGQSHIREYIRHCRTIGLEEALVENGILLRNSNCGSAVRFVSRLNPVTMLTKNEINSKCSILLETMPDRFEKVDNGNGIYRDLFLNVYWNAAVVKQKTYKEALEHAETFSNDSTGGWRLPEIDELITLITPTFGARKYMDEAIFPMGRWFWSNTTTDSGNKVYYINYHFFNNSVDTESVDMSESVMRKSVILVSDYRPEK